MLSDSKGRYPSCKFNGLVRGEKIKCNLYTNLLKAQVVEGGGGGGSRGISIGVYF